MKASLYVTFEYAIENCGERVEPIGAPGSASNEISTCVYVSGRAWGSSESVLMRERVRLRARESARGRGRRRESEVESEQTYTSSL